MLVICDRYTLPAAIYDAYRRVLKPAARSANDATEGAGSLQIFEE